MMLWRRQRGVTSAQRRSLQQEQRIARTLSAFGTTEIRGEPGPGILALTSRGTLAPGLNLGGKCGVRATLARQHVWQIRTHEPSCRRRTLQRPASLGVNVKIKSTQCGEFLHMVKDAAPTINYIGGKVDAIICGLHFHLRLVRQIADYLPSCLALVSLFNKSV